MGIVQTVPRQSCRYPITVKGTGQPRFSFSDKAVSAISPALQGVQVPPVPAKQGQQRSGTERAASPGNGAVQGVWGATPTSRETDIRRQRRMSVSCICIYKCPACQSYTKLRSPQLVQIPKARKTPGMSGFSACFSLLKTYNAVSGFQQKCE